MAIEALTPDDIVQAKQQLEAEGHYASADRILARIGRGSKKTVLRYLRELPPAPGAPADPAPVPEVDPVTRAEAAVHQAETHFQDARDALLHAKTVLLATQNLPIAGILRGTLHPTDEVHEQALEDVLAAKQLYDTAWASREAARQHLEQVTQQHRRGHQEQWVQQHAPALVAAVAYWEEKLRTAPNDGLRAQAKKESQAARYAWHQLARLRLDPIGVWSHSGVGAHRVEGRWHVSKQDLVNAAKLVVEQHRFALDPSMPLAAVMLHELASYRGLQHQTTGHITYSAWREKDHDDLVFCLAMVCWWGELLAQSMTSDLVLGRALSGPQLPSRWQDPQSTARPRLGRLRVFPGTYAAHPPFDEASWDEAKRAVGDGRPVPRSPHAP